MWLPIPGYEGSYSVSDVGRVRSEARIVATPRGPRPIAERILKPGLGGGGYYYSVNLRREGASKSHLLHRLVAMAFIGPLPEGMQTRHVDGNPMNNVPSNLAYGTPGENALDKVRHGRHHNAIKTHCKKGHALDAGNTYITSQGSRSCRICSAEYLREYHRKRKLSKA